jgi:type II secretory pathway component PulF
MTDTLHQLFEGLPDSIAGPGTAALYFLVYLLLGVLPVCIVAYVFYFLLTLPLRRNERARLFLDLLELGIKEGRTPEAAITGAAASQDRSLGARFHLLAAHLESGYRLGEALDLVPTLLPPQIRAMLATGERIGDVAKVLPACRQFLKDGGPQVRGAMNYLVLLAVAITPVSVLMPIYLRVYVIPKMVEVFQGMTDGVELPAFTRLVFSQSYLLIALQAAVLCLLWLAMLSYVLGPRRRDWLCTFLPSLSCRLSRRSSYRFPWHRKRIQRDFSTMLAALLDAGVAEPDAVGLAADATADPAFARRAARVRALLDQGVKLPKALAALGDTGELQWRVANALRRRSGFLAALAGWHEALDAKAFQLEQSAAQLTTTALVLFNGVIVSSIVIAVFLVIIDLINTAVLW